MRPVLLVGRGGLPVEEQNGEQGGEMPPPMQPLPPPMPAPPARPPRDRKRKERYGDNGEFDGAASSFRSAAVPRKPSIAPELEWGVPAFAMPGPPFEAHGSINVLH